jgi:hypothetical protein
MTIINSHITQFHSNGTPRLHGGKDLNEKLIFKSFLKKNSWKQIDFTIFNLFQNYFGQNNVNNNNFDAKIDTFNNTMHPLYPLDVCQCELNSNSYGKAYHNGQNHLDNNNNKKINHTKNCSKVQKISQKYSHSSLFSLIDPSLQTFWTLNNPLLNITPHCNEDDTDRTLYGPNNQHYNQFSLLGKKNATNFTNLNNPKNITKFGSNETNKSTTSSSVHHIDGINKRGVPLSPILRSSKNITQNNNNFDNKNKKNNQNNQNNEKKLTHLELDAENNIVNDRLSYQSIFTSLITVQSTPRWSKPSDLMSIRAKNGGYSQLQHFGIKKSIKFTQQICIKHGDILHCKEKFDKKFNNFENSNSFILDGGLSHTKLDFDEQLALSYNILLGEVNLLLLYALKIVDKI